MIDLDNNRWIRRLFGSGEKWRIFWRFNEEGSGFFHKLKFYFVLLRVPFALILNIPAFIGLGFVVYFNGGLSFITGPILLRILLFMIVTFSFIFAVMCLNEWYGTYKGYDEEYRGQIISGGTRLIIDGILTEREVKNAFIRFMAVGFIAFILLWVQTNYNFMLLIVFAFGISIMLIHDWLKAHGHLNILGYLGLTIWSCHGIYIALIGQMPPLALWIYALIELFWAYEIVGFIDLTDMETDVEGNKNTVYAKYGLEFGWRSYRTIAICGSVLLILMVLFDLLPLIFLVRLLLWFIVQPLWLMVKPYERFYINISIELPFLFIALATVFTYLLWTFLLLIT